MNDFYLSLDSCKKLKEWGCNLKTNAWYSCIEDNWDIPYPHRLELLIQDKYTKSIDMMWIMCKDSCKTYHILEDICVKYAKEFFWDFWEFKHKSQCFGDILGFLSDIWQLLKENKKQEAEECILENCVFNPKNKI